MSSLEGKKILFFAPKFFNYENIIKEALENKGAEVHLYDERGNPSSIGKILIRKVSFLIKKKIFRYYKAIVNQEKRFHPDYIFFLSPETATSECISLLKENFPDAKFILYMYDSLQNKNARKIYALFDRCLSFDSEDCKQYGFVFRPLFYSKSFVLSSEIKEYDYDFCFIGTVHSDRAKILYDLKTFCDKNNLRYYYYLYIPGILMLYVRRLLDKNIRKLNDYIHLEAISKSEVSYISERSKYIIDINHPKQV